MLLKLIGLYEQSPELVEALLRPPEGAPRFCPSEGRAEGGGERAGRGASGKGAGAMA